MPAPHDLVGTGPDTTPAEDHDNLAGTAHPAPRQRPRLRSSPPGLQSHHRPASGADRASHGRERGGRSHSPRPRGRAAGRPAAHRPQRRAARLACGPPCCCATDAIARTWRSTRPARRVRVEGAAPAGWTRSTTRRPIWGWLHCTAPPETSASWATRWAAASGWLGRKHGLQANSVTAVELVTGRRRAGSRRPRQRARAVLGRARRRRQLRVVTALEFDLYPLEPALRGQPVLRLRARKRGRARLARAGRRAFPRR